MTPARPARLHPQQGYLILDLLLACALLVLVTLPLLHEIARVHTRRERNRTRWQLRAVLADLRADLRLVVSSSGPELHMGGRGPVARRGEVTSPLAVGSLNRTKLRIRWHEGREVDWIVLEAMRDGELVVARLFMVPIPGA